MRAVGILVILAWVAVAMGQAAATAPAVSPATEALYQAFINQRDGPDRSEADPAFEQLVKAPQAEVCFGRALGDSREGLRRMAVRGIWLASKGHPKDWDIDILHNKESNRFARMSAAEMLGWRMEKSTPREQLMLDLLAHDPDVGVRSLAAQMAGRCDDPAVVTGLVTALEKDPAIKAGVLKGLANYGSDKCVEPALRWLRESKDWRDHDDAYVALRAYFIKAGQSAVLTEAKRILATSSSPFDVSMVHRIERDIRDYRQPNELENRQYTVSADDLKLTAALDADSFRPGEPIRMHVRLESTSNKYVSSPLPQLGGRWSPLEGLGFVVKDLGTRKTVFETESYRGIPRGGSYQPPWCVAMGPHEAFQEDRCLQSVLRDVRVFPLPPGDYSLTFSCDFSGVAEKQSDHDLLHRWTAPTIKFSIGGKPMEDPKELLAIIGKKVGIDDLEAELVSHHRNRWEYAWWQVEDYGNEASRKYLKELYADHYAHQGTYQPAQWEP